jgi:hypothetical protein
MDDYSTATLQESRNEWCARLINILTPLLIEGFKSIFEESWKLCKENDELDKYLMTFQNFISRIPKWNSTIIEEEVKRIVEKSNCGYLEDLISCVHIIQLKNLTSMRVGSKQKKIDIKVPQLNDFIHNIYINCARKVYTNIYLFERNISPLQMQKHNRELEVIVREGIINTIRDNIPVEDIIKAYMDETVEEDVDVEESEEIISTEPIVDENEDTENNDSENNNNETNETNNTNNTMNQPGISFSDVDETSDINNNISSVTAPKDIDTLEEISNLRNEARNLEEEDDDDEINERIKIGDIVKLDDLDIHDLETKKRINESPLSEHEIEILT